MTFEVLVILPVFPEKCKINLLPTIEQDLKCDDKCVFEPALRISSKYPFFQIEKQFFLFRKFLLLEKENDCKSSCEARANPYCVPTVTNNFSCLPSIVIEENNN